MIWLQQQNCLLFFWDFQTVVVNIHLKTATGKLGKMSYPHPQTQPP